MDCVDAKKTFHRAPIIIPLQDYNDERIVCSTPTTTPRILQPENIGAQSLRQESIQEGRKRKLISLLCVLYRRNKTEATRQESEQERKKKRKTTNLPYTRKNIEATISNRKDKGEIRKRP